MQFFLVKILQFESIFQRINWIAEGSLQYRLVMFVDALVHSVLSVLVLAELLGSIHGLSKRLSQVFPALKMIKWRLWYLSVHLNLYLLLDAVLGDQWLRCKQIYDRHTLCFYHCHCVKSIDYSHHSHYSLFVSSSLCKNRLDVSALQTNEV